MYQKFQYLKWNFQVIPAFLSDPKTKALVYKKISLPKGNVPKWYFGFLTILFVLFGPNKAGPWD